MSQPGPTHEEIVTRTTRWLSAYVLGLNLCPFAEPVVRANRLALRVSDARDSATLLAALDAEILQLNGTPTSDCETTLLIHPWVLDDFNEYNDFLVLAERLLDQLGLTGQLQIASFHPDYCFAGEPPEDPANLTNRSPYPMLHLLREASVTAVLDAGADTDAIVTRNIERLRGLSAAALEDLNRKVFEDL